MANLEIRQAIMKSGLRHWQVADALGISHWTLSIWLRKEVPEEKKKKIMKAIDSLKSE